MARNTHFLPTNRYVDPTTAAMITIGFFHLLSLVIRKNYHAIIIFGTFLLSVLFIAGTSPYDYPPTTRGIMYLLFYFLFAGYGLQFLLRMRFAKSHKKITIIFLSVIILSSNVYFVLREFPQTTMQKLLKFTINSSQNLVVLDSNCAELNTIDYKKLHTFYDISGTVVTTEEKIEDLDVCKQGTVYYGCTPPKCRDFSTQNMSETSKVYRMK